MNIKIPNEKVVAVLKNGEPIKAISARALRAANPDVFSLFGGRDGYDFKSIGIGLFAPDGKSVSGMLVVDEVKRAFAALPDGFIMPINTSHHRGEGVRDMSDLSKIASDIANIYNAIESTSYYVVQIRELLQEFVTMQLKKKDELKIA